jgi:hypothetical protein
LSREYLAAATITLPPRLAEAMRAALAERSRPIRSGRYDDGQAVCPLGAADAFAARAGVPLIDPGSADEGVGYGGKMLRFAVSFDLCAAQEGLEAAVEVVKATLARREQ